MDHSATACNGPEREASQFSSNKKPSKAKKMRLNSEKAFHVLYDDEVIEPVAKGPAGWGGGV